MNFYGMYRNFITVFASLGYFLMYVIPIIIIIITIILIYRNKKIFCYPVRIFRVRENGKILENNYKGGFIKRGNMKIFRIKLGKLPWQYKDLITLPKPQYMDEQNRIYLKQIGINTFIQLRRYFDEKGNVHFSPVESDVEYGAILSIQQIDKLTEMEPSWKKLATIGGMVLVFAMGIIGWALMMNSRCPPCS